MAGSAKYLMKENMCQWIKMLLQTSDFFAMGYKVCRFHDKDVACR